MERYLTISWGSHGTIDDVVQKLNTMAFNHHVHFLYYLYSEIETPSEHARLEAVFELLIRLLHYNIDIEKDLLSLGFNPIRAKISNGNLQQYDIHSFRKLLLDETPIIKNMIRDFIVGVAPDPKSERVRKFLYFISDWCNGLIL